MVSPLSSSRLLTLLFTDLVSSTELKAKVGDGEAVRLIDRHIALVRSLLTEMEGEESGFHGDGFLLVFDSPSAAVIFSLRLQRAGGEYPFTVDSTQRRGLRFARSPKILRDPRGAESHRREMRCEF